MPREYWCRQDGGVAAKESAADEEMEAEPEHKQGLELWHSFETVVSLNVNIRAPGVLGILQHEMRNKCLSERSWQLYQERILGFTLTDGGLTRLPVGVMDPRLSAPPFNNHSVQYVVHRHSIRAGQAYLNAVAKCKLDHKRLYMVIASDSVSAGDQKHFSNDVRQQLLREPNPNHVKHLPGIIPLYIGMRLLLHSKYCVRFGLMNGCECILEHIVFADEEIIQDS
jgi:hypothetical protein